MEDDLKLQDFDQWVKIFILKHEEENLSKEFKISGHPNIHALWVWNKHNQRECNCFN